MGERIVPTVTYFDYDTGSGTLSGWVDYDDAEVDASDSSQAVDLTDVGFIYDGEEYELADIESGASVQFAYGRVVGFEFVTEAVGNNPALEVTADGGTLTVDDGEDEYPFDVAIRNYDALVLDTAGSETGSTFLATLSDGTLMRGEFVMDSEDVPYQGGPIAALEDGTYLVAVTDFTLEVGSATFTETDCAATPMAHFDSNYNLIGLNYSIPNITGQPFTGITGSNGIVTVTFASAPTEVKPETLVEKSVTMDPSKLYVGQETRITIKVWRLGLDGPASTAPIMVNTTDTTAQIRDKIIEALKKKGIFVHPLKNSTAIVIGGRANDNDVGQSLTKISIATEVQIGDVWVYDNAFDWEHGGLYARDPKPIGIYNADTIEIPDP